MKKHCIIFLLFIIVLSSGCKSSQLNHEGKWYCEELQIYLSFDSEEYSVYYLDKNYAERILCRYSHSPRRDSLTISCNELDHDKYENGFVFLKGEIISVTETSFIVREEQTNSTYVFQKTDTAPVPDLLVSESMRKRLSKCGIEIINDAFISDLGYPEVDSDLFESLIAKSSQISIEELKEAVDIRYLKQKENKFYTVINSGKELTYIEFNWDFSFSDSWIINYSTVAEKQELDKISAGMTINDVQQIDSQGVFSYTCFTNAGYYYLSYHAVLDHTHGYGYWIRYDENWNVVAIEYVDTY